MAYRKHQIQNQLLMCAPLCTTAGHNIALVLIIFHLILITTQEKQFQIT